MQPLWLNGSISDFLESETPENQSVMNRVTGQNLAVVSEIKGTTTDPVYKTMELLAPWSGNDDGYTGYG